MGGAGWWVRAAGRCTHRIRFCSRMASFAFRSASTSATPAFWFCSVTSSVCPLIHVRWSSADSACLAAMSFLMWTIAASSGPASSSSSSTPARLAIICSNFLLRRSISCCFFSISVWRRRLSASYFATSASCSLISSFTCFTCTSSCVLFAVTFKVSTRMRASSFCICAPIASFSITSCRVFSASPLAFSAPFSAVSRSLTSLCASSSVAFAWRLTRSHCSSSWRTSLTTTSRARAAFISSASVCSSERASITNRSCGEEGREGGESGEVRGVSGRG